MQNAEGGDATFQFDDPNYGSYRSIVSDLTSLIEHVRASIRLIESAIVTESSPGAPEGTADIIVLDDITPRYVTAGAALNTCNAGLGVALHVLLDTRTSQETHQLTRHDRRAVHSASRAQA
jgi:hypothetical protein